MIADDFKFNTNYGRYEFSLSVLRDHDGGNKYCKDLGYDGLAYISSDEELFAFRYNNMFQIYNQRYPCY